MFSKYAAAALILNVMAMPVLADSGSTDTVMQMVKAGLGDEVVIAKIKADGKAFDLSAEQMIALKQQGVSSAIIAAMLGAGANKAPEMSMTSPDPKVPHPAGFYALSGSGDTAKMQRIDPTVTTQAKTGGILGYALTGGIASMSMKVAIANETARNQVSGGSPRFYMFLDESNGNSSGGAWANGANASISSPSELTLVRLSTKSGRREARVGSVNIAGAKSGVMDKDRLSFTHDMIRPGVYQVDVPTLAPGEYGFLYSFAGAGTGGAMSARIFDFSVR